MLLIYATLAKQVQKKKKQAVKKPAVESDASVAPRRPAYRVKSKEDKAGKFTGITKAMTQSMSVSHEASDSAAKEPKVFVESEPDDGDVKDIPLETDGDLMPVVPNDDSVRPIDPEASGSWMLTRATAKKGRGFSWRMLPNQQNLLDALQTDTEEDDYDDDDDEGEEYDANEAAAPVDEEEVDGGQGSGSASSGAATLSAVRTRINELALKAAAAGKVEIGPSGIKGRRTEAPETYNQSQRHHQHQRSLSLTGDSALVQGSTETTWKLRRKVQI